jgi:hypothetical protein
MSPIFKNEQLDKQLSDKGYIIADSLLDKEEIKRLYDFATSHDSHYSSAFHTTHFSTDTSYKKEVHNLISQAVSPKVEKLLQNFKPIFGNLMIKMPDPSVTMPLHADWCYVDEKRTRSLAVWIPLVDTNIENGCIGVVEGSHRVTNIIRGPNIKQSSSLETDAIWAEKYGKLIPMKAGDAFIYDHALLHFSPANKSGKIRPALNLSMVPQDTEIIHYCIPDGAENMEKYIVTSADFYIDYDNFQRPRSGRVIEHLPKDTVKYIDDRMKYYKLKRSIKTIFG